MTLTTTTHLNFRGTARQALDFYRSVFGGEVTAATYGQFGMPGSTSSCSGSSTDPCG